MDADDIEQLAIDLCAALLDSQIEDLVEALESQDGPRMLARAIKDEMGME